jgi:hypothetical protein
MCISNGPREGRSPNSAAAENSDQNNVAHPGSIAWIRQLTIRQIAGNPGLVVAYPRLFLEKPWLPMAIFSFAGLVCGIASGLRQGIAVLPVVAVSGCIIGAVITSPVSLILWLVRLAVERLGRASDAATSLPTIQTNAVRDESMHHVFPFRPNRTVASVLSILAVAGYFVSWYLASEGGITLFYIIVVLAPIGIFGLSVNLYHAFFSQERVVMSDDEIVLPHVNRFGLYRGVLRVPYDNVAELRLVPNGVVVRYQCGVFHLQNLMFPSRRVYDSVVALLVESVKKASDRKSEAARRGDAGTDPSN